jgi:hypothetical protein
MCVVVCGVCDVQGKPYCEEHYWEVYAPRCHACQQPIREGVIKYVSANKFYLYLDTNINNNN